VDAVEGQHERSEASVVEARTSEGFGKLRLGFTFSIVSVVLFVLSPLGLVFSGLGFLFVALPAVYFLGIYYRASGWRLLGFGQTETVMWLCAVLLAVSPLGCLLSPIVGFWTSFSSSIALSVVSLVQLALWAIYTVVESHNVRRLEKKFGQNLTRGRISALSGILAFIVGDCFALFSNMYSFFFIFPFVSAIFASPFLILSCVTLIRRLKPTYGSDANPESGRASKV
jgi:hypothetical protein